MSGKNQGNIVIGSNIRKFNCIVAKAEVFVCTWFVNVLYYVSVTRREGLYVDNPSILTTWPEQVQTVIFFLSTPIVLYTITYDIQIYFSTTQNQSGLISARFFGQGVTRMECFNVTLCVKPCSSEDL